MEAALQCGERLAKVMQRHTHPGLLGHLLRDLAVRGVKHWRVP